LPPEVDVDVVGLVVVAVVVGEVVFVCIVVEPAVLVPVLVVGGLSEDAVEAGEEALVLVPLLLFAMTTIATTRPTMIAIRLAISKWRLLWDRPPSGPMIRVGSSCT